MLDDLDVDPDLEQGGDDEHSNGWPANGPSPYHVDHGDRELDTADDEPLLGAPEQKNAHLSQASWAKGGSDDCEDDGDDKEPSIGNLGQYCYVNRRMKHDLEADGGEGRGRVDDESSLGWTTSFNQDLALAPTQLSWAVDDGELDAAYDGIADQDALHAM
jgi:hypothetical protein